MPKTVTERVTELDQNFVALHERLRAMEASKAERLELAELRQEFALLRQRFEDQRKHSEEWERRRWGLGGLIVARPF